MTFTPFINRTRPPSISPPFTSEKAIHPQTAASAAAQRVFSFAAMRQTPSPDTSGSADNSLLLRAAMRQTPAPNLVSPIPQRYNAPSFCAAMRQTPSPDTSSSDDDLPPFYAAMKRPPSPDLVRPIPRRHDAPPSPSHSDSSADSFDAELSALTLTLPSPSKKASGRESVSIEARDAHTRKRAIHPQTAASTVAQQVFSSAAIRQTPSPSHSDSSPDSFDPMLSDLPTPSQFSKPLLQRTDHSQGSPTSSAVLERWTPPATTPAATYSNRSNKRPASRETTDEPRHTTQNLEHKKRQPVTGLGYWEPKSHDRTTTEPIRQLDGKRPNGPAAEDSD